MDAAVRFRAVSDALRGQPGVELPEPSRRVFGSQALKVNGAIFAMLVGGHLVVKLPRHRVEELVDSPVGEPFNSGRGRPMKEWLTVTTDDEETWLALAHEALEFVRRHPPRS